MRLTADAERRYIHAIFMALGTSAAEAAAMADVLTEADLRGHGSHGLIRVPLNVDLLRTGWCRAQAQPRIVQERGAAALLDGDRALGPYAATLAAREALARARRGGAAAIALNHCGHIALAGYYVELLAREGVVGVLFAKSEAHVHPWGGVERQIGTNPIAVAVPTTGDPFLLDMSVGATSFGKLREAAIAGRPLPEGWAVDATGTPTTDPRAAAAITPVGGAKGYGLGLAVELLGGLLTGVGAGPMRDARGWTQHWGTLLLALDPAVFVDPAGFRAAVSAYLAQVKGSRRAPGVAEILVPGERSYRTRRERLAHGVEIADVVWEEVAQLARELGVAPEQYVDLPV
ncbi:MAG TPA: Ldh family oxidoreductase [Chloroflexota bacterium]|nr:Ldh family oxidoreductase [Chloroflexota bacterium]